MEASAEEVPRPLPSRPRAERLRDWIEWFGAGRLATIALSVLAVGAGGFWLLRPPPDPVESSLPRATAASASSVPDGGAAVSEPSGVPTTGTTAPTEVVVHVAGAVQVPGVHRLPAGARVVDAVAAAGGAAPHALLDALNLAQPLRDGDRVMVPAVGDAGPVAGGVSSAVTAVGTASTPGSSDGAVLLDLNAATAEQLESLPGVGPATAQAIVAHRDANGPFSSVDGLADVRGIGPAKLEAIRPLVTV